MQVNHTTLRTLIVCTKINLDHSGLVPSVLVANQPHSMSLIIRYFICPGLYDP